ncbi:hypothetical protein EPN90_04470 [Patescibacteria group bacterium]|nr:MAG: hypothetical protein EPN90_04470 [Patescibacteria group bacterium]
MFLQKLEMQGFKSFAARTTLEFVGRSAQTKGVTAIVGPNGSGKSNVADAIRWVLGEQSLKLLRGKKSEDVIFSGSGKKARSGFAEVTLFLNNEDRKVDIEYPEVAITRRLYRDGESEYLINKSKVRLADIQLLLARANFGERHYSVIGQGMIESILQLSPEERKEFFDEATGVKPFQIKKEQSLAKLRLTEENLFRAMELIREIEPRLRTLNRMVKKLEERQTIEAELQGLQQAYYLTLWRELAEKIKKTEGLLAAAAATREQKQKEVEVIRAEFAGLEKEETRAGELIKFQERSQAILKEKNRLQSRLLEIESAIMRAESVAELPIPLPLTQIIREVQDLRQNCAALARRIAEAKTLEEARALAKEAERLAEAGAELVDRLEHPPQAEGQRKIDPKLEAESREIKNQLAKLDSELAAAAKSLEKRGDEEKEKKSAIFGAQRRLETKLAELHTLESRENEIKVEMARHETRRESLEQEMVAELRERLERVRAEGSSGGEAAAIDVVEAQARIQKLKYNLELIGGIDPETVKEHRETSERYNFLKTQSDDLRRSLNDLEKIITELNRQIEEQFERAFTKLSDDFGRYFKILFSGGTASLAKHRLEPEHTPAEEALEQGEAPEEKPKTIAEKFASENYSIEISANPPGKRIKSTTMLSGGERAMTAIALVSAIISNNPSPFVVLDEVDAALDESNSIRFAAIVDELSAKSQFIVITHNRYTMEKSAILYGVTMREDGTSQLLSVSLEEVKER